MEINGNPRFSHRFRSRYYADSRSLYLITDLLPGGDLLEAVEKSYAEKRLGAPKIGPKRLFSS